MSHRFTGLNSWIDMNLITMIIHYALHGYSTICSCVFCKRSFKNTAPKRVFCSECELLWVAFTWAFYPNDAYYLIHRTLRNFAPMILVNLTAHFFFFFSISIHYYYHWIDGIFLEYWSQYEPSNIIMQNFRALGLPILHVRIFGLGFFNAQLPIYADWNKPNRVLIMVIGLCQFLDSNLWPIPL